MKIHPIIAISGLVAMASSPQSLICLIVLTWFWCGLKAVEYICEVSTCARNDAVGGLIGKLMHIVMGPIAFAVVIHVFQDQYVLKKVCPSLYEISKWKIRNPFYKPETE